MSNIDPTKPTEGQATTQSVRDNFSAAADELDALAPLLPGGAQAFAAYLDGYADTGLHTSFTGDANTILNDSYYLVFAPDVTNLPSDIVGSRILFLETQMYTNNTVALQRCLGIDSTVTNKIWTRSRISSVWGAWVLIVDGNVLNFAGVNAIYPVMPTSDPGVPGALWNNGGVVNISL